jgi:diadenylate cyclase
MPTAADRRRDDRFRAGLEMVAPGTVLREGLERILRAETGALLVLGDSGPVDPICSGGFGIDEEITAQRVSELAKMDGAIVLSDDGGKIVRANVHLVPDPTIPTEESGTRHRTAERVAKQTGVPVLAVSQSMRMVTLYLDTSRHVLEDVTAILARANQALQTLERYKLHLDEVSATLSALEVEDLATLRDALTVLQRMEMVRRIAEEIEGFVAELGVEGRLVRLQLDELIGGVETDRTLLVRDYVAGKRGRKLESSLVDLDALSTEQLLDLGALASCLNHPSTVEALETTISPKGYRILSRIPRLPAQVIEKIVGTLGRLPKVLAASQDELMLVEGVGAARATLIKEGLTRLAESSILERYL